MFTRHAQGPPGPQAAPAHSPRSPSCSASRSWPARSCSPTRSSKTFDDLFADVNHGTDALRPLRPTSIEGDFGDAARPHPRLARRRRSQAVAGRRRGRRRDRQGYAQHRRQGRQGRSATGQTARRRSAAAGAPTPSSTRSTLVDGPRPAAAPTRSSSTRAAPTTATSPSATQITVLAKAAPTRVHDRRHRRRSATPTRPAAPRSSLFDLRRPRSSCSPSPARSTRSCVVADDGVSARASSPRASQHGRCRPDVEVLTGDADHQGEPERHQEATVASSTSSCSSSPSSPCSSATFIIYNTFSIIVAQRRREIGAAAGDRRQPAPGARLACSLEARRRRLRSRRSSASSPASLVALGLKALLGALGLDLPSGAVVVLPRTVIVALVVGVGVTVVLARASRARARRGSPPVAAMRDVAVDTSALDVASASSPASSRSPSACCCSSPAWQGRRHGRRPVGLGALVVFIGVDRARSGASPEPVAGCSAHRCPGCAGMSRHARPARTPCATRSARRRRRRR